MPNMTEHESHSVVKMLVLGDSGAGKTGALASLANAGLLLRVLDFDNGMSVLKGYTERNKLQNISYVTCRDTFKLAGPRVGVTKAQAFGEAMDAIDKGAPFGDGIPPISQWGPESVLVIDSLSTAGKASLGMVMAANGAGFKQPEIQHYGTAMDNIEKLLDIITSDEIKCHVIVNTHTYTPEGSARPCPEALGSKLGPKVPKLFDNMISLSTAGGSGRTFKTDKDGLLACKTSCPIKPTYPIATGLADIFRDLTGKKDLV